MTPWGSVRAKNYVSIYALRVLELKRDGYFYLFQVLFVAHGAEALVFNSAKKSTSIFAERREGLKITINDQIQVSSDQSEASITCCELPDSWVLILTNFFSIFFFLNYFQNLFVFSILIFTCLISTVFSWYSDVILSCISVIECFQFFNFLVFTVWLFRVYWTDLRLIPEVHNVTTSFAKF